MCGFCCCFWAAVGEVAEGENHEEEDEGDSRELNCHDFCDGDDDDDFCRRKKYCRRVDETVLCAFFFEISYCSVMTAGR